MAGTALITSELSAADLTSMEGEPRVLDIRLAEALGFLAPHRIRALIRRHHSALAALGRVSTTVVETSAKGGRPGKAFWLTKKQALYVCTKSETPKATEATIRLVDVYDAVTSGTVSAMERAVLPKRPPSPSKGIGIVKLDRVIWFDTRRRPNIGELALVVRHNGALGVYPVVQSERQPEEGYVFVEDKKPEPWQTSCRSRVSLVGAVINASGKPRRTRALTRH